MVLDENIILQTDGTVIAGLLILLTVAYNLTPRSQSEYVGEFALLTVRSISRIIIGVVIPFSVSAILVILGNISSPLGKMDNNIWIWRFGNWN